MKPVIKFSPHFFEPVIMDNVGRALKKNNCYMPSVSRVIYNIGKKSYPKLDKDGKRIRKLDSDGNPIKQSKDPKKQLRDVELFEMNEPVDVLATVVFFDDNTKISVVNSEHDGVKFKDHVLSNGNTIKVATECSKEIGLVYAIIKRMIAVPDPAHPDKMKAEGLGCLLRSTIADSYDSVVEKAELKIARAKSKAEHEAKLNTAKPKKRYSIKETLARINEMLDKADGPKAEGILNKLYSIFKN